MPRRGASKVAFGLALKPRAATIPVRMSDSQHENPVPLPESELEFLNRELKGRYHVDAIIGTGAIGAVYRATDLNLTRNVAIKAIRAPYQLSPKWHDRFHEEARIIAAFAHSNIVQVHEIAECDKRPLIVMEYVQGSDLEDVVKAGIDQGRLIDVMISACEAVGYAHAHGIIHCDIKPRNILVTDTGEVKIADFGIALRVDEEASKPGAPIDLRKKIIRGSPPFMSPEQARGNTWQLSTRTDVFGLGATLYYGLTGKRIYHGGSEEMVAQARQCEIQRPSEIAPGIPPELDAICMKCLEKEPAARYAGAAQVAEDLYRFRERLPVSVRPYSIVQKAAGAICYRKSAFLLSIAVVLALVAGSIVAQTIDHRVARKSVVRILRGYVTGLANTTAYMVDPAKVAAVLTPADQDKLACQDLVQLLKSVKDRNARVAYVYIARKAEQAGYVSFVAMDSFSDPNGTLKVGDVYQETPRYPEMLAAFSGPTADVEINVLDQWRVALSGYAPILDRKGNAIAIVGVDVKSEELALTFRQIDRTFLALVGLSVLAAFGLVILIVRWRIAFWEQEGHAAYGRSRRSL